MRLWVVVFALYTAACMGSPSESCKYSEIGADDGALVEAGARTVTTLDLQSISPPEGGRINSSTVLEVDVEYHIADFAPNRFFLIARFPTTYGSLSAGTRADTPYLLSGRGRAHLCVPLSEVFEDAAVRWPLTVTISINQDLGEGSSRPVWDTKAVAFSPLDVPDSSHAREAASPPEEYVRALMRAFSYFESPRALNTVCAARFPEMQDAFARLYPAWNARHTDTIQLVNTLQLEQFKRAGKNQDEVARHIFDGVRATIAKEIEKFPDGSLLEICRAALGDLADPDRDINGAIGNELRIVRKWQETRPVPVSQ